MDFRSGVSGNNKDNPLMMINGTLFDFLKLIAYI